MLVARKVDIKCLEVLEDFLKVVDIYSDLWDAVMDSQLGLLGDERAGVLTDDPILQNWEGAEIICRRVRY